MRVYILIQQTGHTLTLEVSGDANVSVVKEMIRIEVRSIVTSLCSLGQTDLPEEEQKLSFHGRELYNTQTVHTSGVRDGDLVLLTQERRRSALPLPSNVCYFFYWAYFKLQGDAFASHQKA